MNVASILAISIVMLVLGLVLLRRFRQNRSITALATSGILLTILGAIGIIWFAVELVAFFRSP